MRILGIDPGTFRMGIGVIEGENQDLTLLHSGVLTAQRSAALPVRLHTLYSQLLYITDCWRPHAVAVEKPFVAKNVRSAMAVGQAEALGMIAAAHFSLQVYTYSPRQVKHTVTDYGGSSKEQVQEMVRVHLSLSYLPEPLDATDALAVAICHHQHIQTQGLTLMEEEGE